MRLGLSAGQMGGIEAFVASSEMRKKLLLHLTRGPHTPSELASLESKHVSHVSRALKELRARGLVESSHSESRTRYYKATSQGNAIAYVLARIMK